VLIDQHGASNPPHARVQLTTKARKGAMRRQLREASAQTGFRSQSASPFSFGVPNGERIVSAEIRWPDGSTQLLRKVKKNDRLIVRR
jgi:hypothetical protein